MGEAKPGPEDLSPLCLVTLANNFRMIKWKRVWQPHYADTVGRSEKAIREYVKSPLEEDYTKDQMTLKEYIDPFTRRKNNKA